ncbi:MAG TPA: ABC transporter substrate-binding protein, partial [Candidatus Binatia bacterium]|nr:ABC transporter substrate-binding protein [Candidatus Binatia bacterium]
MDFRFWIFDWGIQPWSPDSAVSLSFLKAFGQGLSELGYVEGRNLTIESRYSGGVSNRFPNFAAELVRLEVNVIVTTAGRPALAAKEATTTIPIVFTQVADPVAEGLVASLARPGGNITGLSQIGPELAGKRLELLQEAFPKISRVAVLGTLRSQGSKLRFKEMQIAAQATGVELQQLEVRSSTDFEAAFRAAKTGRVEALIVLQDALINTHRKRIIDLAAKNQLPTMFAEKTHVEAGGLMSYGPSYFDLQRRAATYVDKILKGRKPADLTVEQPTEFEFVVNLKTAKQLGLTIP